MVSIKAVLHIGIGKAGSSTIQNFLCERRDELMQKNILYPYDLVNGNRLGGDNQKCLAMICIDYNKNNVVFKQQRVSSKKEKHNFNQRILKIYAEQLKNIPENVTCILSAEHFWSVITTEESVIRLKKNLEILNLEIETVVLYIREQVEWLKSFIQQKLIEGSATSLEIPFKNDSAIQARLDYFETIKLWKSAFPQANIVPRIFDRKLFKGGSLISDFWSACGKNDISQDYSDSNLEKSSNVSDLTLEGYLLLALFNDYEKTSRNQSLNKHGTYTDSRKAIMEYLRTEFSGKAALFFTEDIVLHIRNLFKDSNEKVRAEYFDWRSTLFDDNYLDNVATLPVYQKLPYSKLVQYLYEIVS